MSNQYINQNLITVIPGSITIQNFIPGKLFKESIVIYNTSNVPITLNLSSNDKSKLILSENFIKLGVNQAKKISINIQDKTKYNTNNFPNNKLLSIHLSNDLIDENFEIFLVYYKKIENDNSYVNLNSYEEEYLRHGSFHNNIKEKEKGKEELIQNKINPNISGLKNQNDNYIYSFNQLNYQMEKCENLEILGYENEYQKNSNPTIQELNDIIQNLLLKMSEMKEIIDSYITHKNYLNNNLMLESNSVFFISDKAINKEVNNENEYIENTKREQEMLNLQNKNNLLSLENQTLIERINILEKKISNQNQNNNNNKINNNENVENNNFECENNNEITLSLPNNVIPNHEENTFQKQNLDSYIPSQFYSKDNSQKQSISYDDEINYKSNNNNKKPIQ
jgi:hypothetical protein